VKREDLTLAIEGLAALAVVATLIVLIIEVRESNAVARVAAFQEITWEFNNARRDLLNDPESLQLLRTVLISGEYPEPGSLAETKLRSHLLNQFNAWNVTFLSYSTGIIGESEWQRMARNLCVLLGALPDDARKTQMSQLNDEFIAYIDSHC